MKKIQRILALAGVVLLVGMYLVVLYLGLTASPATKGVLMAAIACTIVIPCLLYAMILIARVLGTRNQSPDSADDASHAEQDAHSGRGSSD